MITKFIEATDATEFNWGKFVLMRFEAHEWAYRSAIDNFSLLHGRGWCPDHIVVFDIQTGEGSFFLPGGSATADLNKHKVWVCPMFELFLAWLYKQDLNDLSALPALVNLGDVATALHGYRRPGEPQLDRETIREVMQRNYGSIKDVAKKAGVSQPTVSMVLAGRSTSQRVLDLCRAKAEALLAEDEMKPEYDFSNGVRGKFVPK